MRIGSASTVIFLAEVLFVWATASFAQTVSFGPITSFPIAGNPRAVAVGDFNRDGKEDLVVLLASVDFVSNGEVAVLFGDGTGSFSAPIRFTVGLLPFEIALGDFNADKSLDLAVTNWGADTVSVLLGDGAGSFGAATSVPVGSHPAGI